VRNWTFFCEGFLVSLSNLTNNIGERGEDMLDQEDFYRSFRKKMQDWLNSKDGKLHKYADYLMFGPDLFHLLCKLTLDKDVSLSDKAKLGAAIAYFISPVDFLPEIIVGPAGYVDDIAVAAYVLNGIINKTDPEIIRKHWAGDEDVLNVIKKILDVADQMVGSGLMKKITKKFGS
jgi:uncharacterized membrane protein YkvA (DUF1232 family)